MPPIIATHSTVLFQGDSITDCGRDRRMDGSLGDGYVSIIHRKFFARFPDHAVRFLNRGVSGDRVQDMRRRWQRDALDLHPDWISVLIGINDTWRRYDSRQTVTPEAFEADYRQVLEQTRERSNARILIMEPFLLHYPADRARWREDLNPKIEVARRLAGEFADVFIPLDTLFSQAAATTLPQLWLEDGVHPTYEGHTLIADAWLRAIGDLE